MFDNWIPVTERYPDTENYILLSFSNFSIPLVGRYEEDENGGAFYVGDEDESCVSQDLFVNAWMKLPKQYEENENTFPNEIEKIAGYYGYEKQCKQLIEKMAELMVALNKYDRADKADISTPKKFLDLNHLKNNVYEEIADVEIMLEQIKYLTDSHAMVRSIKESKIKRQMKRIAESEVME